MRTSLGLIAVALLLSSCTRYQYIRFSSDGMPKREMNEFVTENDSLRLVYKFSGEHGGVHISIVNKSEAGFQVDWNRSFLVKGNKSISLFTPDKKIKEQKKRKIFDRGTVIAPQQTPELMVPHSSLNKESANLIRMGFVKGGRYKKGEISAGGFHGKFRRAGFRSDNSPLAFRLQLTLLPDGNARPLILDHSFYVRELWTSGAGPDNRSGGEVTAYTSKQTVVGIITLPVRLTGIFLFKLFFPDYDDEED